MVPSNQEKLNLEGRQG